MKFCFLQPLQAFELFMRHCASLALSNPRPAARERIERLHRLTPGDFATVAWQHRFGPLASATDFVRALEAECSLKEADQSSTGFVH